VLDAWTGGGSLAVGSWLDQRGAAALKEGRGSSCLPACREGEGSAGRNFAKGAGVRMPKAKDERKKSRAQLPAAELRMREEEAGNRWMESWAMGSILLI
jgi:hypothetical protein